MLIRGCPRYLQLQDWCLPSLLMSSLPRSLPPLTQLAYKRKSACKSRTRKSVHRSRRLHVETRSLSWKGTPFQSPSPPQHYSPLQPSQTVRPACLPLPSNIGLGMHKRRCKITWPLKDYFSSSRKKDTKIFILQFLPHRLRFQLNLKEDENVLCFLLRVFSFESYDKTQCWKLLKKLCTTTTKIIL